MNNIPNNSNAVLFYEYIFPKVLYNRRRLNGLHLKLELFLTLFGVGKNNENFAIQSRVKFSNVCVLHFIVYLYTYNRSQILF